MDKRFFLFSTLILQLYFGTSYLFAANNVDQLTSGIKIKSDELKKINREIQTFNTIVKKTKNEAQTLRGAIHAVDSARESLRKRIDLVHKQVVTTEATIKGLEKSIVKTNDELTIRRNAIGETVRVLEQNTANNQAAVFLGDDSFGTFLSYQQGIEQLQKNLTDSIRRTKELREELEVNRTQKSKESEGLQNFRLIIEDQKKVADIVSSEKKQILKDTKSKEAVFQKLLEEKQTERDAVEQELFNFEAELKFTLDPSSIPPDGTKVLAWPTDGGVITQLFGNTAFSQSRKSVYNGRGHNGIDIGVPIGTPIYAAADGIVRGFGNTDLNCKGASYGNWILIDHRNNLSTLYAHLSSISVESDTEVKQGTLIGYSGKTGYSTGPHLHFSVFAKRGVDITSVQSKVRGCGRYILPLASFNSYLNPLSYTRSN